MAKYQPRSLRRVLLTPHFGHPRTRRGSHTVVRRLGTIIQSIFLRQSGASIRLTVWKWSGESRYSEALPPVLENFRRAFSPDPTDCPLVSEDVLWRV